MSVDRFITRLGNETWLTWGSALIAVQLLASVFFVFPGDGEPMTAVMVLVSAGAGTAVFGALIGVFQACVQGGTPSVLSGTAGAAWGSRLTVGSGDVSLPWFARQSAVHVVLAIVAELLIAAALVAQVAPLVNQNLASVTLGAAGFGTGVLAGMALAARNAFRSDVVARRASTAGSLSAA